jgi:hypothetical protein
MNDRATTATFTTEWKILVAGGYSSFMALTGRPLRSVARMWSRTAFMHTNRALHTATLLPNGKVLVAGGRDSTLTAIPNAELYDVGLLFNSAWQPQIDTVGPLNLNNSLTLTGSKFRGVSQASTANGTQNSPSDCPVVPLTSLGNEQTLFLHQLANKLVHLTAG